MGGNGAAERFAEEDDVPRGDLLRFGEVAPGGLRVGMGAGFRRRAGRGAVAAVIEQQRGEAQLLEHRQPLDAVGDRAGVAVEEQHRGAGAGRRHEPAGQRLAVGGGDAHILKGQAQRPRRRPELAPHLGEIDEARLEHDQDRDERAVADGDADEQDAERCMVRTWGRSLKIKRSLHRTHQP